MGNIETDENEPFEWVEKGMSMKMSILYLSFFLFFIGCGNKQEQRAHQQFRNVAEEKI
ncbi:hypothetical protein CHISP_0310 [Chitinispirillum alkaliphilum]|nr:hypothetical protein CHISP_0310 [Chitinispirillum alkaliphilum]